jgi:hypothetical protein
MLATLSRMSVSYPVFLVIVGGMLFAGVFAIPTSVLAIRYGVARGIKVIGTMIMPVVGLGAGVGLLWVNPIEGEYKVGLGSFSWVRSDPSPPSTTCAGCSNTGGRRERRRSVRRGAHPTS